MAIAVPLLCLSLIHKIAPLPKRFAPGGKTSLGFGKAGPDGTDLRAGPAVAALLGIDDIPVRAFYDGLLRALGQAGAADDALLGDPVAHDPLLTFFCGGTVHKPAGLCQEKGLAFLADGAEVGASADDPDVLD